MTKKAAFTIRVGTKTMKRLDQLSAQLERSRNYLVKQAIHDFLELQAWQVQKIHKGLTAANQGDFASDQELKKVLKKYRASGRNRS
jgi:predicted transcriptional regulator